MSRVSEGDRCETCGQTRLWHEENNPRHPFSGGQDGSTAFLNTPRRRDQARAAKSPQRGSDGPQIIASGNDPVLRIALINRGILTPADLVVAEDQLRAALMEVQNAQQAEGARRGQVQVGETTSVDVGSSSEGRQEVGPQPQDDQS